MCCACVFTFAPCSVDVSESTRLTRGESADCIEPLVDSKVVRHHDWEFWRVMGLFGLVLWPGFWQLLCLSWALLGP